MKKSHRRVGQARRPWVQDATFYVEPTSNVSKVELHTRWAELTEPALRAIVGTK